MNLEEKAGAIMNEWAEACKLMPVEEAKEKLMKHYKINEAQFKNLLILALGLN